MMKVSGFSVTRDGEEQTKVDRVIRVTCIVSGCASYLHFD